MNACERVGHGGASALARANTLRSFDAALEVGVDTVEFDVRAWRGELVLAHTLMHARLPHTVKLSDALEHLRTPRFAETRLIVDVKHAGFEQTLLEQLQRARLLDRSLLSSQVASVLDRIHELEPLARTGISVGGRVARVSRRWRDWREQVLDGLARHRWDALMAQHRLIDPFLRAAVSERGASLYAWTVNDRAAVTTLRGLGVDGIVTADPRLLA